MVHVQYINHLFNFVQRIQVHLRRLIELVGVRYSSLGDINDHSVEGRDLLDVLPR